MKFTPLKCAASAILIVSTFSFGLHAAAPEQPKYSATVQVIVDNLNRLALPTGIIETDVPEGQYANAGELLVGTVDDFLNRGWCKDTGAQDFDRLECVKANFKKAVEMARNEGALDSLEGATYLYYTDGFTFDDNGKFTLDADSLWSLGNPKKAPKRNQVALPILAEYREKKLRFQSNRAAANPNTAGRFSPEFMKALSKVYRKKIRGLSDELDSIDYVTAKYSVLQINELSQMMHDAIYKITSSNLKITGTGPDGKDWAMTLESSDFYAYMINNLEATASEKTKDTYSTLNAFPGSITLEDILLASILTGDSSEELVGAILSAHPEFDQPKTKFWSTVGGVVRSVMPTLSILVPVSLPVYMLGSVILDTVQRNKADRKDFNNETRRILIRNPS